jgi:cardiolipin synthase
LAALVGVTFVIVIYRVTDAARARSIAEVVNAGLGSPLRTSHADFAERAASLAAVELSAGHRVEVLPDTLLFTRLFADLSAARSSITFMGYYCEPGRLGDRVSNALSERARAGVTVLFMGDDFGCRGLLDEVEPSLRAAGVRVARFRPVRWHALPRVQHRLHSRAVVIDGTVGYTGGFGISDKWVRDTIGDPRWRDTSVRVEGPAVADMQASFLSAWAEATGELLTGGVFFPAASAKDDEAESIADVTAGFLYSRPGIGPTPAERYLAVTLAAAERTLWVANSYFVPTPLLVELLLAAEGRGVDVRLLLPNELIDIPSTRYAGRSFFDQLLNAGVRIYEYQPAMMHAKTMVVDGSWVALGTLNMDNRSMRLNDESALLVHDERVGALMDSMFLADLSRAREITTELHATRPLRERMMEWMSRRVAPLL